MPNNYLNFAAQPHELSKVDERELEVLDKDSITSINEFMKRYAEDKTFTPPESNMVFDSDISDVDIDTLIDDIPSMSYDFEEAKEDEQKVIDFE